MDIDSYFSSLNEYFGRAYGVASEARRKGYDPETFVEIKQAADLASRVEGIMGIDGLADIIRKVESKSRQELAFKMVAEISSNPRFEMELEKRITLAVRVGLSVLTEGILVAPTEGFQRATLHKNPDGSDYVAVVYAGPIRGAGGTSAALSVALADYCRKMFNISAYKPQPNEIERYIEEINIYHARAARLQYLPKEEDIRVILENCPVCIDGLPTEELEIGTHRNVSRLDAHGKPEMITNRVRGGIALVICEGIAQKAKSALKYTKMFGLDWLWLNNIIKADKVEKGSAEEGKNIAVFLQELVAGRPVLAYPNHAGSFRLRYGRSRFTGIAAKGFSPATMLLLDEFIATGTQLKVEKPGKGCIAMPVDTIEGPFVKLADGRALRINSAEEAREHKAQVQKIFSVGDILVTFGDFKKTNTTLQHTSYVEEYWLEQLRAAGHAGAAEVNSFEDALSYSRRFGVPMHPRYIYDYDDVSNEELAFLTERIAQSAGMAGDAAPAGGIRIAKDTGDVTNIMERLCIPHTETQDAITITGDDARSLATSLALMDESGIGAGLGAKTVGALRDSGGRPNTEVLSELAPFKIMHRSVRIGGRIGRPEKARERLMKPAPHALFPVGEYGGKERSITKAYLADKRRFGPPKAMIDMARYRCSVGKESIYSAFCVKHNARAYIEKFCERCGRRIEGDVCEHCGGNASYHENRAVDIGAVVDDGMRRLGVGAGSMPKTIKGIKGVINRNREIEPIEKGILRAMHNVLIFKDGTARFDATDAPITHFYPDEIGISVDRLKGLGYTVDYLGNELKDGKQLVEMRHQDVIINRRAGEFLLNVSKFVDSLLKRFYNMEAFYNAQDMDDLVGHCVVTLSPHTSCGVLGRIIGFSNVNVGLAHPYTISARRRNCDGDEDTTMLLLDALINFSKRYLPTSIGGTMDAPLILTTNVVPEEVDDEVWEMEVVNAYGKEFYDKTMQDAAPGDVQVERVGSRLKDKRIYDGLQFTHLSGISALADAPVSSTYVKLKTMQEKIDRQFALMDRLYTIDKADTARRLILSHFIPDLIGNLHSFSRQTFRCIACNAKYRRVPLIGKCRKCGGKLVLTISKGGIEKYMNTAINLADRYGLEPYITQRLKLVKKEIEGVFGGVGPAQEVRQFDLSKFL